MKQNFTIQQLSEENFWDFFSLFRTVFDSKTSYQFLYQKYNTAYLGTPFQYLGFLAFNDDNEAISYCGCIPFKFKVGNTEFIGAHSCDHMTRKDARGNKLFSTLNNKADELVKSLGIPLVFGFPNQNNHPILVKYGGWNIIDTTRVFKISVNTLPLSSVARRNTLLKYLYNQFISLKTKNRLSGNPISKKEWQGIIRDSSFYAYKTYSKNYTLQFEHGRVWFKINGALFIGDIQVENKDHFIPLINELKNFCKRIGVSNIFFISSSNTLLCQQFETITDSEGGNGIGMKIMLDDFDVDLKKIQFTLGDYDTF